VADFPRGGFSAELGIVALAGPVADFVKLLSAATDKRAR
jgi:hypothetical protein